ncbi:hypothetical protein FC69_GL001655 [Latilactobacillus fuchuensis DSM 14340 = JCM 11249]|nr:hypothetical protein FC69_GL001655 [Latilactobacillus fuchuensis DSM 14340 = JCM 11249]
MTTRLMDQLGFPYENTYYGNSEESNSIDVNSDDEQKRSWSERKVERLKEKYEIQQLPLVKIIDDDSEDLLEYWAGFQPSKIQQWHQK